MEGPASWGQIIFLGTVLLSSSVGGFLVAWRLQVLRSADIKECYNKVAQLEKTIEGRLSAIELFNAATTVTLDHIENFRKEVQNQYENLRSERASDMQAIHVRLDAIFNTMQMAKLRESNKNHG